MTTMETYYLGPGTVENYMHWIQASGLIDRGNPPTKTAPVSIQITGTKEVMQKVAVLLAAKHQAVVRRLRQNGDRILTASKIEVPVDMTYEMTISKKTGRRRRKLRGGRLKQSGTVELIMGEDAIRIGYNTEYAFRQHEDMTYRHTRPGAKAKYLEDPAMRIAPTIAQDIADNVKLV
jgi:hypothetical protein